MRQIFFDKEWGSKLMSGEKTATILKSNPFINQIEFSVNLMWGKFPFFRKKIGYSKVISVKNIKGKNFYDFSLKDVTRFRNWITVAHQYGYLKAQDVVYAMIDKYNPKADQDFQIVIFHPVKKKPYGDES